MSELSSLEGLSPLQRRELLTKLLRQRGGQPPSPHMSAPSQPRQLRQSCAQQRLWVLNRLGDESACYNIVAYFQVHGPLNEAALETAFCQLVRRHETLRTTFRAADDGAAMQSIAADVPFSLGIVDLSAVPESEAVDHLRERIRHQQVAPFDLEQGPLIRVELVRSGAGHQVVVIAIHHIIADGWSMGVLARDLGELYAAAVEKRDARLPDLPIQYGDFSQWQLRWLEGEECRRQLGYWTERLADLPPLELSLDFLRPGTRRFRGDQRELVLSEELSEKLRRLAASRDKTLFMVVYAAMTVLLARMTGRHDIAIGSAIANRNRAELEGLIGFFVNMLVLRTDVSDDPTFDELLERAAQVALDAYAHQDCPFEKLVERLASTRRDTSRNPLFQVALAVHNQRMPAPAMPGARVGELFLPGFTVGGIGVSAQRTRFDLELHVWDRPEGIRGTLVFDTDLFRPETISHMLESLVALLECIVATPKARVSELGLISPRQRGLIDAWGQNASDYPRDASVSEVFEAQAVRRPDAIALVSSEGDWTYAQLDARANEIARELLQSANVARGEFIAFLLPRSGETIAAMLAVLKAGGAYVPLDPSYPPQRLALLLEDSGARVVLTTAALQERLPASPDRQIVCIDELTERGVDDPAAEAVVRAAVTGADPAYVMYTSGSTGTPKGVVVPHRAITRLVLGTDYAELSETTTTLQMATLSFDASTFEVWGALLNGGRCVLYPGTLPTPTDLGQAIARHNVDTLFITTALFNTVIEENPLAFAPLKQILFGGEAASVDVVRRAMETLPHVRISNIYGPTEVTTFSTSFPIATVPHERQASIPIGRPIRNTDARVVDANGRLVPPGVPGELWLGGDGVAIGYHRRPEFTAERFVTLADGRRWYRTGDLVRWLDGGAIEFLGRLDGQVKVHGFRIELAEVEVALRKCDGVSQAYVLATGEGAARRLVAYVTAPPDRNVDLDEVRSRMRTLVPEFMVPSQLVRMERLPLNANGKVDKAALPAPEVQPSAHESHDGNAAAPAGDIENRIMQIWRDVLKVDRLGVTDNFFDIGGQSLLLVQVHERLRRSLAPSLPVVDLFQYSTVRSLAEHVARLRRSVVTNEPAPGTTDVATTQIATTTVTAAQERAARQRAALQKRHAAMTKGRE